MDLCRICGDEKFSETLSSLQDSELMIELKLEKVFNIKLTKEKLLPQSVCFECIGKLENSVSFFELLTETQEKLINTLNKQLSQVEEIDEQMIFTATDIKTEVWEADWEDNLFQKPEKKLPEMNLNTFPEVIEKLGIHPQPSKSTITEKPPTRKRIRKRKPNPDANPVLLVKVEDVFPNELSNRVFEETPDELSDVEDDEKNVDGTLTEEAESRLSMIGWNNYEWKCCVCSTDDEKVLLDSAQSLETHFKTDHSQVKISYPCQDCKLSFKSYFSFQNHAIEHRRQLKFCCEVCNTFRWNLIDLYTHRKDCHAKHRNTCLYCGKIYEYGSTLKQHSLCHRKISADEMFYCDLCDFHAPTKFRLINHITYKHTDEKKKLVCETCGKLWKRLSDLRTHQSVHTDLRQFGCDLCDLKYKDKHSLNFHRKSHFPQEMKFECSVCFKKFPKKHYLTIHFRVHTEECKYTCEFCNRKFKHNSGFKAHRRIHTGERPYVCSYEGCDQKFIDWSNMNKHMKSKHSIDNSTRKKKKVFLDK